LKTPARLTEWESKLIGLFTNHADAEMKAWVVLPNHYHLLVNVRLKDLQTMLGRLHNGASTQWNREDGTPGRKVWYRFADRAIRSERHFYAAINYIHGNPAKHNLVDAVTNWPWSSFNDYSAKFGLTELRRWWKEYPVNCMGEGWDDEPAG
jgi:putative transposase